MNATDPTPADQEAVTDPETGIVYFPDMDFVRGKLTRSRAAVPDTGDVEALARDLHRQRFPTHADCNPNTVELGNARRVLASDWLTAHDAEVRRDTAERAWDEAAEAVSDWMSNNPSPSGIPHDPPRNPFAREGAAS